MTSSCPINRSQHLETIIWLSITLLVEQWDSLGSMMMKGSIQLADRRHHDLSLIYKQEPSLDFPQTDPTVYGMTVSWSSTSILKGLIPKPFLSFEVSLARYRAEAVTASVGTYRVLQTVTLAGLYSTSIFVCTQGGLTSAYYTDVDFSIRGPRLSGIDSTISFDWGGFGPPVDGIPVNGFSVRWTGFLKIPSTDVYTFTLNAHDEAKLFVAENLVLISGKMYPIRAATLLLNQYTMYPIRIDYRERLFYASIHLLYAFSFFISSVDPDDLLISVGPTQVAEFVPKKVRDSVQQLILQL
jgi:hypothetical protein